jgi:hypothetical protein
MAPPLGAFHPACHDRGAGFKLETGFHIQADSKFSLIHPSEPQAKAKLFQGKGLDSLRGFERFQRLATTIRDFFFSPMAYEPRRPSVRNDVPFIARIENSDERHHSTDFDFLEAIIDAVALCAQQRWTQRDPKKKRPPAGGLFSSLPQNAQDLAGANRALRDRR